MDQGLREALYHWLTEVREHAYAKTGWTSHSERQPFDAVMLLSAMKEALHLHDHSASPLGPEVLSMRDCIGAAWLREDPESAVLIVIPGRFGAMQMSLRAFRQLVGLEEAR